MLITIDAETHYSPTFSLSKMTTEAYIRSPEFEVIGMAIKIDDGPTFWYPQPRVKAALAEIDWSQAFVLAQNCVTGDHEVRTRHGWVRFDQLVEGVEILQWCTITSRLTYTKPVLVKKRYSGPMLEWNSSFHKGVYTPDHRMYITTPSVDRWTPLLAQTAAERSPNNQYVPTGGVYISETPLDITPEEARVLEMIRADGYIVPSGRQVRIRVAKSRKIERAAALLAGAGLAFSAKQSTDSAGIMATTFAVASCARVDRLRALLGTGRAKGLGSWVLDLKPEAREAWLDELQYWDGYRKKRGDAASKQSVIVHSAKRDDIYWIAEMAIQTGYTATVAYDVPNARGWSLPTSVLHQVRVRPRRRAKTLYRPTVVQHDGYVYCVNVATSAFLVRRNGATWVTGNCAFDAAILSWHYGVRPKVLLDTLGMSRALFPHEKSHSLAAQAQRAEIGVKGDEVVHALGKRYKDFDAESLARYGRYCCNDVELTYTLFKRYTEMGFPVQELKLIDLTLRMFTEPLLRLDSDLLVAHLKEVRDRKAALLDTLADTLGTEALEEELKKSLMSNPKFAELLKSYGVEPPMKISPTTGKETYAFSKTDEEFLALQEHPIVEVQALAAARLGTKSTIEETRTERFLEMSGRGAFPVPLRYYGAHSSRWSAEGGINLQNLPSRGQDGGKLKNAILAPEGHVIIDADSAQIEVRVLAWLAGQDDLVESFRKKEDVYRIMASKIYGKPPEEINKTERQIGKVAVLGCGYGISHNKLRTFLKLQAGVEVDESEAKRIVDTYRRVNYKIADLWKKADTALTYLAGGMTYIIDAHGICIVAPRKGITLPNKLHIQYPGLRQIASESGKTQWVYDSKGEIIYIYGAKVVENLTQGIARCVVAEQMLRISKRYPVVLTVHDSAACVAPAAEAEEAQRFVEECMSWTPAWAKGLPLACESGVGESYGAC